MNEFVSLFVPLIYAFLVSAFVFLLLALVLIVRKRSKNGAVPIPVGVSRISAMIPKAITAPIRWWAKHPWMVSWGAILLYVIVIRLLILVLDDLVLDSVNRAILLLLSIVLILSFVRAMFLNWQRSKIATIVVVVFVYVGYMQIDAWNSVYRRSAYFSEIRSHLREAAHAQESYFDKNNSFKSCVACTSTNLPGYDNRNPKVTLVAEVGKTEFVMKAQHENCGDSEWVFHISTGEITGPNIHDVCK